MLPPSLPPSAVGDHGLNDPIAHALSAPTLKSNKELTGPTGIRPKGPRPKFFSPAKVVHSDSDHAAFDDGGGPGDWDGDGYGYGYGDGGAGAGESVGGGAGSFDVTPSGSNVRGGGGGGGGSGAGSRGGGGSKGGARARVGSSGGRTASGSAGRPVDSGMCAIHRRMSPSRWRHASPGTGARSLFCAFVVHPATLRPGPYHPACVTPYVPCTSSSPTHCSAGHRRAL